MRKETVICAGSAIGFTAAAGGEDVFAVGLRNAYGGAVVCTDGIFAADPELAAHAVDSDRISNSGRYCAADELTSCL